MIVNDNPRMFSKWSSKFIDDTRVIIYNSNMFIIQATELFVVKMSIQTYLNKELNFLKNQVKSKS